MWRSWREATERALYGETGFYRRQPPFPRYRTSVHSAPFFAAALVTLLREVDAELGRPDRIDVVDIGAGSPRLLKALIEACPPELRDRLRPAVVELGPRPARLGPDVTWTATLPDSITGLVVANEWLDNVPVDVVEQTDAGPRVVLVEQETGAEKLGGPPAAEDLAWLRRWWPLADAGDRAEIGRPRDEAWAAVIRRLAGGLAVTADYDHRRADRPPAGTLTGYRDGRQVVPVPDGSCDVTAHVALDACAAAGIAAGATATALTSQREALRALGIRGARPPIELAGTDPRGYLKALHRAGAEGELTDRAGLGGFGWLAQSVGIYLPAALAATMGR